MTPDEFIVAILEDQPQYDPTLPQVQFNDSSVPPSPAGDSVFDRISVEDPGEDVVLPGFVPEPPAPTEATLEVHPPNEVHTNPAGETEIVGQPFPQSGVLLGSASNLPNTMAEPASQCGPINQVIPDHVAGLSGTGVIYHSGATDQTGIVDHANETAAFGQAGAIAQVSTFDQIEAVLQLDTSVHSGEIEQAGDAGMSSAQQPALIDLSNTLPTAVNLKRSMEEAFGSSMLESQGLPNKNPRIEVGTENGEGANTYCTQQQGSPVADPNRHLPQPDQLQSAECIIPVGEEAEGGQQAGTENEDFWEEIEEIEAQGASVSDTAAQGIQSAMPEEIKGSGEEHVGLQVHVQEEDDAPAIEADPQLPACSKAAQNVPETAVTADSTHPTEGNNGNASTAGPSNQGPQEPEGLLMSTGSFQDYGYKVIMVTKPLRCRFCQRLYVNEEALTAHFIRSHREEWQEGVEVNIPTVKCLYCNQTLQNEVNLRRHVSNVHRKNVIRECATCGAQFSSTHAYATHRRDSHGEGRPATVSNKQLKVFKCSTCGAFATSKGNMERHIQIRHLKLRPFACQCGKRFRTKNNLQCHLTSKFCDR